MKLKVAEIFQSISGEVGLFAQGSPTTFLRLAGCNLSCPMCDTKWANEPDAGVEIELGKVVEEVFKFPWYQVLITGGEPLLQKPELQKLIYHLKGQRPGLKIQIETNGTQLISNMYLVDSFVVDCKEHDAMGRQKYDFNPGNLRDNCWVKFLVGSWEDVDSMIGTVKVLNRKDPKPQFAVSPVVGSEMDGMEKQIITQILDSKLPITLNIQLHKRLGAR